MNFDSAPLRPAWTEILPGVVRWSAYSPGHKVDLASHAVATGRWWTVFDPTPVAADVPPPWGADGLTAIVITNANHERDLAAWRGTAGVWAPAEAGIPGARRLAADEAPPGWTVWPLDGGAPGETALLDVGRGLMVFGDAVVNLAGRGLEVLPSRYCGDPARLRLSLRRLPAFASAVFAHGEPLLSGASERIAALL